MLGPRSYSIVTLIKKVPRPIKLMAVVMFLFEFGFGFIDPWWTLYANRITNSYWLVGVALSLFALSGLLITLPLGKVIDQFDHKKIIRASLYMYLVVAALYLSAGHLNSIPLLIMAVIINGISSIMIFETGQAYVDHNYQGDKSFNYSYYISHDALGYILGTLAVLAVVTWWPLHFAYLVVLIFVLFNLVLERRLPSTALNQASYWEIIRKLASVASFVRIFKSLPHYSAFFYIQVLVIFTLWFINAGFIWFLPLFGVEENLSLIEIGLTWIFFQVPLFLSVYYATVLRRFKKKNIILIFFCILAALFLLFFAVHTQAMFYVVSFLVSSAIAILDLTVRPVIFSLSPDHLEGEAAGVTKFAEKLAAVISPLVVGFMASGLGFKMTYLVFAILAVVVGWVSFVFYHRHRHHQLPSHYLTKFQRRPVG